MSIKYSSKEIFDRKKLVKTNKKTWDLYEDLENDDDDSAFANLITTIFTFIPGRVGKIINIDSIIRGISEGFSSSADAVYNFVDEMEDIEDFIQDTEYTHVKIRLKCKVYEENGQEIVIPLKPEAYALRKAGSSGWITL